MNNQFSKKFFLISFLIHIFILILFLISNSKNNKINDHFLVYGIHSKEPSLALFKSMKKKSTQKWFQKRIAQNKKQIIAQKKFPIKKNQNKISSPKKTPVSKKVIAKKAAPIKTKNSINKQNNKLSTKKEIKKYKEEVDELHFNLIGTSDPMLLKYQINIQSEVARLWHPPIGVPKGTECSVKFCINKNGIVNKFKIKKASNILLYDLSIVRIAKNFKFDRFLWGKKFIIDFRQ